MKSYFFKVPKVSVSPTGKEDQQGVKTPASPEVTGVADWLICDEHIVYLNGYADGAIRPQGNITRAETAMVFYRLLKKKDVETTSVFSDVPSDAWYAEAVSVLSGIGVIHGYQDGTFRPDNLITRAEFAAIATRFAVATGGKAAFTDVPSGYWAEANIATAAEFGWISGYGDGTYGPTDNITRAQAATIVNHMTGRAADREYVLANLDKFKAFTDLQDPKAWYYYELVEASTEHDFTKSGDVEKWTVD